MFWKFFEVLQKAETVAIVGILQNEGGHQPPYKEEDTLIATSLSSELSMNSQIVKELIII